LHNKNKIYYIYLIYIFNVFVCVSLIDDFKFLYKRKTSSVHTRTRRAYSSIVRLLFFVGLQLFHSEYALQVKTMLGEIFPSAFLAIQHSHDGHYVQPPIFDMLQRLQEGVAGGYDVFQYDDIIARQEVGCAFEKLVGAMSFGLFADDDAGHVRLYDVGKNRDSANQKRIRTERHASHTVHYFPGVIAVVQDHIHKQCS